MIVRPATEKDLETLGRMGAALAELHHRFDPQRFLFLPDMASGYAAWFRRELENASAFLRVAERDGVPEGYAYAREEARDWNLLLDRCGVLHDLWVEPAARGRGAGKRLVEAVVEALEARGLPRIVLSTAHPNDSAQRLFAALGWRPTMIEMTRELERSH